MGAMSADTTQPPAGGHPYDRLLPAAVLDALEAVGYPTDGRLLALNSYENRVYQVGIEDAEPLVVKFYRPGRWSRAAILEEHQFAAELAQQELPVVAPLADPRGTTLHEHADFLFALYRRQGGRAPELDQPDHLRQLGRLLARLHGVGAVRPFRHRPALTMEEFGQGAVAFLLAHDFVPVELRPAYESVTAHLLEKLAVRFAAAEGVAHLRLHGDCHPGNILWRDGPHFVDLDDARSGPAVQDLWMLLSGPRAEMESQLAVLLDGYSQFRDFDPRELQLVEALRSLRMLHFSAWLARRWDDPAFPPSFPWFQEPRYWEQQILGLREQLALLDEPPLAWF